MKKVGLIALFLISSNTLASEEKSISVGLTGGYQTAIYKNYDNVIDVLPVVLYENNYLYWRGIAAGAKLFKRNEHNIEFGVSYTPETFKPSRSKDSQLKLLNRRKSSISTDIGYYYTNETTGKFSVVLSTDILDKSQGSEVQLEYSRYFALSESLYLEPVVGIVWSDKKFNDYYYGISKSEAGRSGLPPYHAKSTLNPYAQLSVINYISEHWSIMVSINYQYLGKGITRSPLVEKSSRISIGLGVNYDF